MDIKGKALKSKLTAINSRAVRLAMIKKIGDSRWSIQREKRRVTKAKLALLAPLVW